MYIFFCTYSCFLSLFVNKLFIFHVIDLSYVLFLLIKFEILFKKKEENLKRKKK